MANNTNLSLQTDFNVAPFYDDFNEDKNYHRILAVPGLVPQAREFTQAQTILQNQIDRLAGHIFQEGSIVRGGEFRYQFDTEYVKVDDTNSGGNTIILSNYEGMELTGVTSGVKAVVIHTANGTEAEVPDTKTFYVKYTRNASANTSQKIFTAGENLTSNNGFTATIFATNPMGFGAIFTYGAGVIYSKDHFVRNDEQTIILEKYDNTPSARVGFFVKEEIITSATDSTLLDISTGEPNYAAAGARRLKLTPLLQKFGLANTVPADFIELFQVKDGILQSKADRPQYADIMSEWARRTYNESGDYIINGFAARVKEHLDTGTNDGYLTLANGGNTNQLAIGIEAGIAMVHGFEYENLITRYVAADKGIDFKDVEALAIPANYGNYVLVNENVGSWDVDNHPTINLLDTTQRSISNLTYSAVAAVGNTIGTAKIRAMVHESGNPGANTAQYRAYLYDIIMSTGKFGAVKALTVDNAVNADCYADTVLVSANATLNETTFNKGVFDIPANYIRSIREAGQDINNDTNFQFMKSFDVTIAADGTFSIATGSADETYPFSTGALNATQKDTNFVVSMNGGQTVALTGTISVNATATLIAGIGTSFTTELALGDKINANGETLMIASITNANTAAATRNPTAPKGSVPLVKEFLAGDVLDMAATGSNGTARSITVTSTTGADFVISEGMGGTVSGTVLMNLNKVDGQEIAKTKKPNRYVKLSTATHIANTVGPWSIGLADIFKVKSIRKHTAAFSTGNEGANVTNEFLVDNGQRDNFYTLGKISLKTGSNLTIGASDHLLILVDYFTHDTSQGIGYLSVDSYPVDDVNGSANVNGIQTKEIPIYTSPITGASWRLRDSIDIRPILTNSASDSSTVGGATTNPNGANTFTVPSGGLHTATPNENFTMDLSYYLPRKDLVVLTNTGRYTVVRGVSDKFPLTPVMPPQAMKVAAIDITPYPSLPALAAQEINRADLAVGIRQLTNRRYTMRDIGVLDQRLRNQEYYNLLNLLEKDTAAMSILDSNGLDRFKNGVLVDPFMGHRVGDVQHQDYQCSIDKIAQVMRPRFELQNVKAEYSANSSNVVRKPSDAVLTCANTSAFTNGEFIYQGASYAAASIKGTLTYAIDTVNKLYVEQTEGVFSNTLVVKGDSSSANSDVNAVQLPRMGDLVTLPYTHEEYIIQAYATTTRNAAGINWQWKGHLILDPPNDYWADTTVLPELRVNFDNNYDNWVQLAQMWETDWGDWETIWTGTEVTDVETSVGTITRGSQIIEQTSTRTTSLITDRITRAGETLGITPQDQTYDLGERIIDTALQPYMRSRPVFFYGYSLKPNTIVYPFFDKTSVAAHCAPVTFNVANNVMIATQAVGDLTASDFGGDLVTNEAGDVAGVFIVPQTAAMSFTTGNKLFRLTDNITNERGLGLLTTAAEAEYASQGLRNSKESTILATRNAVLGTLQVSETEEVDRVVASTEIAERVVGNVPSPPATITQTNTGEPPGDDPLAQSFFIRNDATGDSAMYISKLELFFQTKHASLPIMIEIRPMHENRQIVKDRMLPFGRAIVYPGDINLSNDGAIPTPITFPSPVLLERGRDYVIFMRAAGNNPDYRLWTSILGDIDLATGERVSVQPYVGMLFASANDKTWSPVQDEDLKFTIHAAAFDTTVTGTLYLDNQNREFMSVANSSARFGTAGEPVHSEVEVTVNTLSGTANVGERLIGDTTSANGIVTNITGSIYRLRDVGATLKFTTGENLTFRYSGNGSTTGATANLLTQNVSSGELYYYNDALTANVQLHLKTTVGSFTNGEQLTSQWNSYKTYVDRSDHKLRLNVLQPHIPQVVFPEAPVNWSVNPTDNTPALDGAWKKITANKDNYFTDEEKNVLGLTQETADLSGQASLQLKALFTTDSVRLSGAVDLSGTSNILVGNIINNNSAGETAALGGSAKARYITRQVILADGQDAEDLKVFLTAYKPAGTSIEVYAKLWNAEDSDLFEEQRGYVQLSHVTSTVANSDTENRNDYKEFEYSIAAANLTGDLGEVQYVNTNAVTFTGYKIWSIKVVLLAGSSAVVPTVTDVRAMAIQL